MATGLPGVGDRARWNPGSCDRRELRASLCRSAITQASGMRGGSEWCRKTALWETMALHAAEDVRKGFGKEQQLAKLEDVYFEALEIG